MKRSEALAPLSRDHHVALVVARDLLRAGEADRRQAAERFGAFLREHELRHFALEEAVLLDAIPAGDPGPGLKRRLLADHAFLRDAMHRLGESPDLAFVHEIGARLRGHVQMEERELFPLLEATLDETALGAIGRRLR